MNEEQGVISPDYARKECCNFILKNVGSETMNLSADYLSQCFKAFHEMIRKILVPNRRYRAAL